MNDIPFEKESYIKGKSITWFAPLVIIHTSPAHKVDSREQHPPPSIQMMLHTLNVCSISYSMCVALIIYIQASSPSPDFLFRFESHLLQCLLFPPIYL